MNFYFRLLVPLLCLCTLPDSSSAQAREGSKPKQFIYVLRLVPRLHAEKDWTKEDEAVIGRHLAHFKEATKRGQLILAGRTLEPGDTTFGLAIFEATDEAAARAFMESDPAVAERLMTAELHPFTVVHNTELK